MGLQNIFPTPIYTHFVPQNIANKMEEIITPKLSNLKFDGEVNTSFYQPPINPKEIFPFLKYIDKIAFKYSQESKLDKGDRPPHYWIQDYKNNFHHSIHCHPNSYISGTYYIRANENAGELEFQNPNYNLMQTTTYTETTTTPFFFRIKPQKGLLVLFPPWLLHKVVPSNKEDCIRTSFSFNY
jgi:uncharacterized protein (TIGR02466 family)